MTPKGEDLTLKGEITDHLFNLKREISISYSKNAASFHKLNQAQKRPEQSLQMMFVLKGTLNYQLPNSKKPLLVLKDQQHNLLLNHHQLQLHSEHEEHDVIFLTIDYLFLSRYLPHDHTGFINLKKGTEQDKAAVFSKFNLHITPEIIAILNALKTSGHTGFCEKLFLESKALELLVLQLSQYEQLKNGDIKYQLKKDELDKMYEVQKILTNDTGSQFSLRTLAHMVGTNEFNLKRNFKIAFGTTVYGYLNQHKMEQAKSMLLEKDITIAELARKMGYRYPTHFSSAFKKYFGYLPNKIKMIWLIIDPDPVLALFSYSSFCV
ncbi:helix-turn-helix domain-containing protein [Pedobacter psychroterrae]|nr:AraC family transcriptional regulator [Pedobacter psychroterrae]